MADEKDTQETEEREKTPGEKAQARIDKGNRAALKAEAELAEDREEKVREGQVFDDMAPGMDDIGGGRRRLKVLLVDGEGDDAQVLVENLSTLVHSRIRCDRLLSDAFQRSV